MATPKPDTEGLVDEFNALLVRGRIISDGLAIQRLKKRINAQKDVSYAWYHAFSASLSCIRGDVVAMHESGRIALSLEPDGLVALHHATNLENSGLFTQAWELFAKIDDEVLTSDPALLEHYSHFFSLDRFVRLAEEVGATTQESYMTISKAHEVLERSSISEKSVTRMLDLAGAVLKEHGLLSYGSMEIYPYLSHGTVTISLPVNLSAEEVAELEWEFCNRLFDEYPDAPVHIAQVGFCVGAPSVHA